MTRSGIATGMAALLLSLTTAAHAEEPAAAAAPAPPALGPSFSGPMAANPATFNFELPVLGKIYAGGVASAFGQVQNNAVFGDHDARGDASNAMVIVQKVDGVFQFYLQAGIYSFPAIGTPYLRATTNTDATFGALPVAFLKLAPSANFSVQAGKLPTLIGAEGVFSFQNINVDRGLLWNQENVVNKGVQVNLTAGKFLLNVALTDGFYSGKYNWVTGLLTYTIDPANAVAFAGGGSLSYDARSSFRTPLFLNNSQMYNIIFTHNAGKWMVQPYVQYTHVPRLRQVGSAAASTYGGALLVKYMASQHWSIPARVEYIDSTGKRGSAAPNLLYGQGSNAFSATVTPTYTNKIFFARAELNYVHASSTTAGAVFDDTGNKRSQVRGLLEAGVVF